MPASKAGYKQKYKNMAISKLQYNTKLFITLSPHTWQRKTSTSIFTNTYYRGINKQSVSNSLSVFLRSRHGESAYIIEQGWNLVVNRPEFRPHLIGRGIPIESQ